MVKNVVIPAVEPGSRPFNRSGKPYLNLDSRFTVRSAGRPGMTQRGFTLIELLVVVLIIGILASVAVPQYQLAVEKSRTAEAWSVLASLKTAMQVYGLANGDDWTAFRSSSDPWSLLDLSLDLPKSSGTNAAYHRVSNHFTYSIESPNYVRAYRGVATKASTWPGNDYDLFIDLNGKQWSFSSAGKRLCGYKTAFGKKVCQSMGPHLSGDKYLVQ